MDDEGRHGCVGKPLDRDFLDALYNHFIGNWEEDLLHEKFKNPGIDLGVTVFVHEEENFTLQQRLERLQDIVRELYNEGRMPDEIDKLMDGYDPELDVNTGGQEHKQLTKALDESILKDLEKLYLDTSQSGLTSSKVEGMLLHDVILKKSDSLDDRLKAVADVINRAYVFGRMPKQVDKLLTGYTSGITIDENAKGRDEPLKPRDPPAAETTNPLASGTTTPSSKQSPPVTVRSNSPYSSTNPTDPGIEDPLQIGKLNYGREHVFKGQRQPHVGTRLQHVLNFLADKDQYRDPNWLAHLAEIKEYLDFLESEPQFKDFCYHNEAIIAQARQRVQVHELFDKFHAAPDCVTIPTKADVPRIKPRLQPIGDVSLVLGQQEGKPRLPRKVLHRIPQIVNDLDSFYPKAKEYLKQLAKDEDARWEPEDIVFDPAEPIKNLSYLEEMQYKVFMNIRKGWVTTCADGTREICPGEPLEETSPECFAVERGARRAGLQQCLQYFRSHENQLIQTPYRRLILPVPAAQLTKAAEDARKIQFEPLMLKSENIRGKIETHPYTIHMAEHNRVRNLWLEEARMHAEAANFLNAKWVTLPRFRDVYVSRPFPTELVRKQNMFLAMKKCERLLEYANAVAGRKLLTDVIEYIERGKTGQQHVGDDVLLFRDGIDYDLKAKKIILIQETEVHWLKFLTTGSCNHGLLKEMPYKNATMFYCFADRLRRLMEDKSPERLFKDMKTRVPLEELLNEMDKGTFGNNERKTKFSKYDAMCWLDRLCRFGRCIWEEDSDCYGYISRQIVDIHPEHQIWASTMVDGKSWLHLNYDNYDQDDEDDIVGAPRRNIDIATWDETVESNRPWKLLHPDVWQFFCNIAFRFGLTWYMLAKEEAQWKTMKTTLTEHGRTKKALRAWDMMYNQLTTEGGKKTPQLTDVVKLADPDHYRDDLTEDEAATLVKSNLLSEAEQGATPLHPVRLHHYKGKDGTHKVAVVRPPIWDWAQPEVRGVARRYFSLDRWPLHMLEPKTKERIESDADLDPRVPWDPCSEDVTPAHWYTEKAAQYLPEKVVFREGPAVYQIGDTPRQMRAIQNTITNQVAEALGIEEDRPRWFRRISGMFSRPVSPTLMPEVGTKETPQSVDWAEVERRRKEEEEKEKKKLEPRRSGRARGGRHVFDEDEDTEMLLN